MLIAAALLLACGWLPAAALAVAEAEQAPSPRTLDPVPLAPPASGIRVFADDRVGLRLRSAPSTAAPVIATVDAGTQVAALEGPILADGISWWKIAAPVGTGWAPADQLG